MTHVHVKALIALLYEDRPGGNYERKGLSRGGEKKKTGERGVR